jgi:amino acid transporter
MLVRRYRQTIRAYPQGGGSYIVASEELGRVPGLMAAAGLLIDHVITVAVSIASGVAAITRAYPSMQPATVWIGVGVIVILLAGNLRGFVRRGSCSPYRRTPSSRPSPPWWLRG